MKYSLIMFLLSVVVIVGLVGFVFSQEALSPIQEEVAGDKEVVEFFSSTTDTEIVETVSKPPSASKPPSTSPVNIFKPKVEDEQWHERKVLVREPCDFVEMQKFMEDLLASPKWANIVKLYPKRTYVLKTNSPLDIAASGKWMYTCHIEVSLLSEELIQNEFETWTMKNASGVALALLNPTESYQAGALEFVIGNTSITFLLADGPNGSSFGTYQYDSQTDKVRLFSVLSGFQSTYSVYEADILGKEMCPCIQHLKIKITNQLSEADLKTALDKKENFEDGLETEE
jgi:hypothetical protein